MVYKFMQMFAISGFKILPLQKKLQKYGVVFFSYTGTCN